MKHERPLQPPPIGDQRETRQENQTKPQKQQTNHSNNKSEITINWSTTKEKDTRSLYIYITNVALVAAFVLSIRNG